MGLSFRQLVRATVPGNSVPIGAIASITLVDATQIDPQPAGTGAPVPAATVGANGTGWVAAVVLKGLTSLVGTLDATQLTLTVQDPGYTTAGVATTVTRTIHGVVAVRRQYPNGNTLEITTDGANLTLLISLDDWVYSGTTIVSAAISGTFYTGCVASAAASKVNISASPYPKSVFGWLNLQQESTAGASTFAVEAVAFHRHARNGQQVAAVNFYATDGTNTAPGVLVSATSNSALITGGNVPEVWAATLNFASLTQGATCQVMAQVYPWIGDSTAVTSLATDGAGWPTSLPLTPLRVVCDRTGAYGGGYAYVKAGATGGAVNAVAATAATTPFPTISGAMAALAAWNNTNKGHNDIGGGFVRLMDNAGAAQSYALDANTGQLVGAAWCTLEKDPASAAVITLTQSATIYQISDGIRFRNISIIPTTGGSTYVLLGQNQARSMAAFDNCIFDNTQNKTWLGWFNLKYFRNVQFNGTGGYSMASFASSVHADALYAGCTSVATVNFGAPDLCPKAMIGCTFPKVYPWNMEQASAGDGDSGRIMYNNKLYAGILNGGTLASSVISGFACVQNQFETDGADGSGIAWNFLADGDTHQCGNYIEMHNTCVGNRCSRMYNDAIATRVNPYGAPKSGVSKFNIWHNYNIKTDTFNANGAGAPGNWAYYYSVGNAGNVSLFGDVSNAGGTPNNNNSNTGGYLGGAWLASSTPSLVPTLTNAQVQALFTTWTVSPATTPAVGGNYKPTALATQLKGRVPAGLSVLKYDIAGTARRVDGTGAAGCFESA